MMNHCKHVCFLLTRFYLDHSASLAVFKETLSYPVNILWVLQGFKEALYHVHVNDSCSSESGVLCASWLMACLIRNNDIHIVQASCATRHSCPGSFSGFYWHMPVANHVHRAQPPPLGDLEPSMHWKLLGSPLCWLHGVCPFTQPITFKPDGSIFSPWIERSASEEAPQYAVFSFYKLRGLKKAHYLFHFWFDLLQLWLVGSNDLKLKNERN